MHIQFHFQPLPSPLALTAPRTVLMAHTLDEVRPVLQAVEQATQAGAYAAGFVSYEAAPAFDPALAVRPAGNMPLAWFGIFDAATQAAPPHAAHGAAALDWQPLTTRAQYAADIATIRAAIAAGATYQVNYTLRLQAAFAGEPAALFQALHAAQPAPYSAYLDLGHFQILSLSPELFFHRRSHQITTRPMKGTAARGRWAADDDANAAQLAASAKERAENLMIVDLLRNDLGRIAQIGSVRVPDMYALERYPTVWQMTSTVTATERPGTTLGDVFAALFPCGSVTGAPKISTMQLIAALETQPRGVYCGAIGIVLPGGEAIFNVGIRTLVLDLEHQTATYGVGGGITIDSTAEGEYAEVVAKAALLREQSPNFALLETLRLTRGRYRLRGEHMQRFSASARYFDIPLDMTQAQAALDQAARAIPAGNTVAQRVRLLVSRQGDITTESVPILPVASGVQSVVLVPNAVRRADRFLYHKTTYRAAYEAARALHPHTFDVLLLNEDGEATEFTIGNLVVELDGRRWTPPIASGLLGGVLRAVLLRRGAIAERSLFEADVRRARRMWLINSVRGAVEVRLELADLPHL